MSASSGSPTSRTSAALPALAATLASRVLRRWWRPAACSRPVCAPYAAGRRDQSPHPRVGPVASNFAPRAKRRARTVGPRARSARARRRSPGDSPFLDVDDVAAALAKRAEKRAHRRGAIASASERAQAMVTDGTEDSRKMSLLLLASLSAGDPAFRCSLPRRLPALLLGLIRQSPRHQPLVGRRRGAPPARALAAPGPRGPAPRWAVRGGRPRPRPEGVEPGAFAAADCAGPTGA